MNFQVIPFGDRMLVKRRKTGEKAHGLYLPDEAKNRPTDLADVLYVADQSFADKQIIDNSEDIIESLTKKARGGDSQALDSLLKLNEFLRVKMIKPGDSVFVGKYVGVDFHSSETTEHLTLVKESEIIGLVRESKKPVEAEKELASV